MYLKQTKRKGRIYLSVMQNYRSGGKVHAKTVENIGYADEFSDRYEDPIAHFKAYVADLNRQAAERMVPVHLTIPRDAQIAPKESGAVQLGSAIALGYLDALGVGRFFNERTAEADSGNPRNPDAGLGRAFELLVTERMIHAVPVHETWSARGKFPRTCGMELADAYRGFEQIARCERQLVSRLNARYTAIHGERRLESVRLVFSNYVFAWPGEKSSGGPDEIERHTTHRLCLVIDEAGIPLTYRIVPRHMTAEETLTVIDELKGESSAEHVTVVAAQLPAAAKVVTQLVARHEGFVLLMHASETTPEQYLWAADDQDYLLTRNKSYRIKSRMADLADPHQQDKGTGISDGAEHVKVKEIALQSTRAQANQTFFIVSNETAASNAAIFNIYRELWRVHEPFQVIAADFIAPPYAVDTQIHLRAHFVICYTAFFALRMLRQDMDWAWNAAQVADALVHMEGAYLDENWYLFNYRSRVTDDIQRTVGVGIGRRLLNRADIRSVTAQARRRAEHREEPRPDTIGPR
ncbi:MAG: hypothetical protein ACOX1O_02115 [Eggerthellaceae bacterium]|jgi:hypothetical protein